jgi:hypothetical protein
MNNLLSLIVSFGGIVLWVGTEYWRGRLSTPPFLGFVLKFVGPLLCLALSIVSLKLSK